jgi:hypothetical protein
VTTPAEIMHANLQFLTYRNLHVYGKKTMGACLGVLSPRIVIDREMEMEIGFEALCYHEGCHAFERHRFFALLLLVPSFVAVVLAFGLSEPWWLCTLPCSPVLWVWWAREQETRADAMALHGAGRADYFALISRIGRQRTRWGSWCYGRTLRARERRARERCDRNGWSY